MSVNMRVLSVLCDDGELVIYRAEHMPSHKTHKCSICGARIRGAHFAYQFKNHEELFAILVVRACCDEHKEALEEALAGIEDALCDCAKGIDSATVWNQINQAFLENGITLPYQPARHAQR